MNTDLAIARGLLGAASVGPGPTDEQRRIIDCLAPDASEQVCDALAAHLPD